MGLDGEGFAPERRGLTVYQGPGPRTMPEDIEDQLDVWPDGKGFPLTRQAEPKAQKTSNCVPRRECHLSGYNGSHLFIHSGPLTFTQSRP